jgi:D-alanyl-D-alanine dipeptidase
MSLSEVQQQFAQYVAQLLLYVAECGYGCTLGEAYRPQEMQELYYEQGKTQTLNSMHTKRLALDINLFKDGVYLTDSADYTFLGEFWCSLDPCCEWGGNWTTLADGNHFELNES